MGSNFLVIKKDRDDSSSEDGDEAVSTFSDDDGPQMFDCNDEKENDSNDDANDDATDDSDEANEENDDGKDDTNDEKDDTDDDDYDECTDTNDDYEGFTFLQNKVMCSLQDKAGIPTSWILLDSQSTVDVFSNKKLLTNIRDSKGTLTLYCNTGKAIVTQKGDLKGYGSVWYYPQGIVNILSLHNIEKKHKVTYDSSKNTGFVVHKADCNSHVFMPSKKGLYFSDVENYTAHIMINTVDSIKNKYTVKECANACKAHSIQDIIGRLSTKDYIEYVEKGLIPNCPITKQDIIIAEDILGPNLGSLKGKTTRRTPARVVINTLDDLPDRLLEEHGNVIKALNSRTKMATS